MRVVIAGGGLAGLSAALHLPERCEGLLLEKEDRVGGLLRTDRHGDFLFDHGPHLFFHTDPYFIEMFEKATATTGTEKRPARTGQWSFQKLIDFPYALHLKSLPDDVVAKCVGDFADRQVAVARERTPFEPLNYEAYCRHYFGDGFTDHFMIPYAVKIWTVHPRDLATDWVGQRIVLPELREVIRGALTGRSLAGNYIKEFRYPKTGGTQSFVDGFTSLIGTRTKIRTHSNIVSIDVEKKCVTLEGGAVEHYDSLISTLPLPELVNLAVGIPRSIRDEAEKLDWFGVLLLNFGASEVVENPYQWIYFDQSDAAFHRIHYPSKLADQITPNGFASIQAEISFSRHRALPSTEDSLLERAWKELKTHGYVGSSAAPTTCAWRSVPYAYAIMDHKRATATRAIRSYFESNSILTCGRFGEWDYIWTDKVLHSGKNAAAKLSPA